MPSFLALLLTSAAHAITGGQPVAEGEYPDYAMLIFDNGNDACSGTLIAPDVVLTAAYCVHERLVLVRLGPTRLDVPDGEEIQIREMVVHPDSNGPALLLLVRETIKEPARIALDCALDGFVDGAGLIEVGYGATDESGLLWPDEVHWADSRVRDHDCSDVAGCRAAPGFEFATGGPGGGCAGDGGGPVYLPTDDGRYLVGISHRGADEDPVFCSGKSIHLRADAYKDWIEENAGIVLAPPDCAASTEPEPEEEGCGCATGGGPLSAWPFALFVLVGLRSESRWS